MKCPKCDNGGDLDWVLTACEFKCSVCGNTLTFTDLKELGYLDSEFKCPKDLNEGSNKCPKDIDDEFDKCPKDIDDST